MKLCIFSDIHGNTMAFQRALPMILQEKADAYVCLGDTCGYYFDTREIFEALQKIPRLTVIKGNHEQMFVNASDGDAILREEYRERYGPSLEMFLRNPDDNFIHWARNLPEEYILASEKTACFHANPLNRLEGYVYPDSDLSLFENLPYRLVCLGHTHYRMVRRQGQIVFVNPGSIGQPRDGKLSSYAIVDTQTLEVNFKDVHFNVAEFMSNVREKAGSHSRLFEVLERIPKDG